MAQAASFDRSERLPWLSDPKPTADARRSRVPLMLIAAAAGAAGAAGWTALQRAIEPAQAPGQVASVETVRLPPPVAVEPKLAPVSDRQALAIAAAPPPRAAEPSPPPKVSVASRPRTKARITAAARPKARARTAARAPILRAPTRTAAYDPRAWNSGVQGRIIQLGAFRTPVQANGQWNRVYYQYPLLRPLPPRVVRTNIRGRTFYRLQLGTFSHAHSELLCQRLRAIGEGCIVLGLNSRGRRA